MHWLLLGAQSFPKQAGLDQLGATPDDVTCFERGGASSFRKAWLAYDEPHLLHRLLPHADHYERHFPARHGSWKINMLEVCARSNARPRVPWCTLAHMHRHNFRRFHSRRRLLTMRATLSRALGAQIGIQSGGSARMWKRWYGQRLRYVGVDIEPATARTASPSEDMHVMIGSQADEAFLRSVCARFGPFDLIIDDGGHTAELMRASLRVLFPEASGCMKLPSMYVIEDTQTMMFRRFTKPGTESEMYALAGEAFYAMHYGWAAPNTTEYISRRKPDPIFGDLVSAVHACA